MPAAEDRKTMSQGINAPKEIIQEKNDRFDFMNI